MSASLFGTDGIRGKANQHPVTAEVALRLGLAAASLYRNNGNRSRVVIAKDTRLSGYMLEPALTAGFVSGGMDVFLVGPMPTPAVAMLTRSLRADMGVMISASHNPYDDNGIKLFDREGYKLSDAAQDAIEARMNSDLTPYYAPSEQLGRAKRLEDARGRYMEYVKSTFPKGLTLEGMKIVVDCAHGAAYTVGPEVLWELGAEVIPLGVKPNGFNINKDCGSTHPASMQERVVAEGADVGIALDGDADRLVMCDEKGQLVDGDQLMAMVTTVMHRRGLLRGGALVATQMSNLGLEHYLATIGISLKRAAVGDRYVMEMMRSSGCNVGGEQSGHIILSDYATTGDGLLAGLQVLALLRESGKRASEAMQLFTPVPQLLKNLRYQGTSPLTHPTVQQAIEAGAAQLNGTGRLFVRASGTEPLIRVMAEGQNEAQVAEVVEQVLAAMKRIAA